MSVRTARPGDEGLLSRLHHAVFETSVWDEKFWYNSITDDSSLVLIAEASGTPGGLIATRQILDEAEILTLGVIAIERRQGHARLLLEEALKGLEASGVTRVFLEVATDNDPAIQLYAGAGFSNVGQRKDYYGSGRPALIMEWCPGLPEHHDTA
ncbi:GNAT family N-acetyltransferase [Parvularcula marina]|uniref:GNAT family N-acetyltransferase n=1 Tax=Parvularcula marina TaxID=2292771 RepID=A0A371RIP6_9PROT|nr:GNAT family N-acetyltransferase [Parvularcula marina]RFB05314.1 GNAT family N-acetyltransferase [Parvularcula marina]